MAEEQKTAPAANTNVEAEKDVQNVLEELKGDGDQAAPEKKDEAAAGDAEEARIVAEAAKLGEKSEKSEEKTEPKKPESDTKPRGGRGNRRNNAKFDPTTQKETDDPVEIRKQVSHVTEEHTGSHRAITLCRKTNANDGARSNSTSPTLTSQWTNSFSPKWAAAPIVLFLSA
jgi:hypothetical protein